MGQGWNLGNSLDGFDTDTDKVDSGEIAWGNPVVTKEFIKSIKDRGYDSIRIPMTAYRRYSEVDGKYIIDAQWINRYKEIVDWAVEAGLYVMINIHHDSWIWLSNWDGNKESEEYRIYVDLWEQLAYEFKDYSEKVCFETINEPTFDNTGDISAQEKLDMINGITYEIIRNSGGNNDTRMIVIPTMHTNHESENSIPTYKFIKSLNDNNVIATVHYYSEWVFSANLGKTGFDEALFEWSNEYTARVATEETFNILKKTFIGQVLQASLDGKRSSYSTELNTIYLSNAVDTNIDIELTLNGNEFIGIENLTEGVDFVYDGENSTVTLLSTYVNGKFNRLDSKAYGEIDDLVMTFSSGANWHQYLVKYTEPVLASATGDISGLSIPVEFNGAKLRHATAYNDSGEVVNYEKLVSAEKLLASLEK